MSRLAITQRQLRALTRVVASMNLVQARISVTGESDLLSSEEMLDLERRLLEGTREEPDVVLRIDW